MKALNHKEILHTYLTFIGFFSALLLMTILCWFLYLKTEKHFVSRIRIKKQEIDFFKNKSAMLSSRIDSISHYMALMNTKLVNNEVALQRHILQLKNATLQDIENLERNGDANYFLYKKVLSDVERVLEAKQVLQQAQEEEEANKRKLLECTQANLKLRNR